jgi:hypothetical protein
MSTICMKIDPSMHIGLHLVFFGKTGVTAGRPSPVQGPIPPSFDLAAIRAIYSPGVESHASSNSSSTAEEQRREGHHPGEERVELVD